MTSQKQYMNIFFAKAPEAAGPAAAIGQKDEGSSESEDDIVIVYESIRSSPMLPVAAMEHEQFLKLGPRELTGEPIIENKHNLLTSCCVVEERLGLGNEDKKHSVQKEAFKREQERALGQSRSLRCDSCGKKCRSLAGLKVHQRSCTQRPLQGKNVPCGGCPKPVQSRIQRSGEKCPLCSKALPEKAQVDRHVIAEHGDGKAFMCGLCQHVYTWAEELQKHLESEAHTGLVESPVGLRIRPYVCNVMGCSRGFKSVAFIEQHQTLAHLKDIRKINARL